MKHLSKWTIGMDLGDKTSRVCALNSSSGEIEEFEVATTLEGVSDLAGKYPKSRVIIEVGTHSRWISKRLANLGLEVVVANARQLSLITQSKRKNDRNDALILAELGNVSVDRSRLKILKPIEHRSDEMHADLMVLKSRDGLVQARTKLVNMIRGFIKATGNRLPSKSTESFHFLKTEVPLELMPALEPIFEVLESLATQIRGLDRQLEKLQQEHYPDTNVMTKVRGVGALTALAIRLTLANASRFKRSRDAAAYLGLCPAMHESGKLKRDLGITKCGDPFVRKLLVQAAHYILGPFGEDCDLRRWGTKLMNRGGGGNRKRAATAVARKLATILHRLWMDQSEYEPLRSQPASAA